MNRWSPLALAAALCLACLACKGDPAERDETATSTAAAPPPVTVEPASLPLETLARLAATGDRELGGPCARDRAALDALAAAANTAHTRLAAGVDTATGPAALETFATTLRDRAGDIDVVDDESELARTRGELVAVLRDLADASTVLAGALRDRDPGAAGGARLRLDNGADNLTATLDRLELLCGA